MKKFFTKRNIYITLFAILYGVVALVSLIHSFSFFGLANNTGMAVMLGTAFEIGQAAVLFAILTSSKDRSRIMPWALMILLTAVQVIGNVFSSYKYLMLHNVADLQYFKEPIFIWTSLPDNQATVIITYIVGAILPVVALCMTSMIANYLEDNKETSTPKNDVIKEETKETIVEQQDEEPHADNVLMADEETNDEQEVVADEPEDEIIENNQKESHFINI